jgi:hypothetical protein
VARPSGAAVTAKASAKDVCAGAIMGAAAAMVPRAAAAECLPAAAPV